MRTDHVFSPGHEPLVDDLCGIVSPCINMYTFLDYRVAACAQCLSCLISAGLYLRLGIWSMHPGSAIRGHFVYVVISRYRELGLAVQCSIDVVKGP